MPCERKSPFHVNLPNQNVFHDIDIIWGMLLELEKFENRSFSIIAVLLYVVSLVGNLVIFYIGKALGAFPSDYYITGTQPLTEVNVIFLTTLFLLAGYSAFFMLIRMQKPIARIRVISIIVVLLTLILPLLLPSPPSLMPIFLELMHIYTGIVVVFGLTDDFLWNKFSRAA